jgi:hypothetical protein
MIRISGRPRSVQEILGFGHDVVEGGRVRRITLLAALTRLGLGDRVVIASRTGDTRAVALDAPGLALTANNRRELKLIDLRSGFGQILAAITEIRDLRGR